MTAREFEGLSPAERRARCLEVLANGAQETTEGVQYGVHGLSAGAGLEGSARYTAFKEWEKRRGCSLGSVRRTLEQLRAEGALLREVEVRGWFSRAYYSLARPQRS